MASQAPSGTASVVVSVMTAETVVIGALSLPSVALGHVTHHFHLLEVLNNPRLASPKERPRESLVLSDVYVLPEKGPKIAIAQELHVRPESIVCAYEYEGRRGPAEVPDNPSLYRKPERVVIVTTNGFRLEGTFLGGVGALAAPKQKRFLPLPEATLGPTDDVQTRLAVPFLAVNNDAIAAFTQATGEADRR